jgi:hypothetical protein
MSRIRSTPDERELINKKRRQTVWAL